MSSNKRTARERERAQNFNFPHASMFKTLHLVMVFLSVCIIYGKGPEAFGNQKVVMRMNNQILIISIRCVA
jgi:hypothetical protein